jgi:hypothetical protein
MLVAFTVYSTIKRITQAIVIMQVQRIATVIVETKIAIKLQTVQLSIVQIVTHKNGYKQVTAMLVQIPFIIAPAMQIVLVSIVIVVKSSVQSFLRLA